MALIKSSVFGITFLFVLCLVQRSFQDCTKPSNLDPNVVINPDQQSYYTYYYIDVSCQSGSIKNGPDRCYCTPGYPDDHWDPDPSTVTCEGCSRPFFTNPYAILLNPDQPTYQTYYGTVLTCEDGHTSRGLPTVIYCNADGTWDPDPSDGLCYAQCNTTELLDDENVETNSSDGAQTIFDHSEVAYFSCRDNLAFTGQDSATCINGSFHFTDAPRCLMGCSRPVFTNPYAILLNPDQPTYGLYDRTDLTCEDGHISSGLHSYSYCYPDGRWDPDPSYGLCYAQCNTTELLDDDIVATNSSDGAQTIFDHSEVAYFSCRDNLAFAGQESATCINGSFHFTDAPVCSGVMESTTVLVSGCSRPVFTNPYAILLNPDQPTYQTYYATALTCEDGHTASGLLSYTYCDHDGTWNPDPTGGLCYAHCNTTELLDDNIVATNSSDGAQTIFDHSEVAYFSCRDNLAFTGQDSATCINGSFHFTDAPRCLGCSRPVFTNPYAIILNPDQPTYLTYYLTALSCKDGHTSSGLPSVTYCIIDGTWDPDPAGGLCYAQCNTTELTDNGVVATDRNQARQTIFDYGEIAYFSCQDNFTFTGQASATCINGSFDFLEEPECLGCSIPSVQPNVAIEPQVSSYDVNFKVTLSCVGDRTPNGPEFSYCNREKQWEPDPKTLTCHEQCKSPALSDPRVIHTSNLSGSSGQAFYPHADSISFSCADGIYLAGLQRATCHNGQWYPRIHGYDTVCKDNCTSPPNMSNMGVMFRHGESHVFECDVTPGMIRMGGPKSVCNDGRWKPRVQCALPQDLRSDL